MDNLVVLPPRLPLLHLFTPSLQLLLQLPFPSCHLTLPVLCCPRGCDGWPWVPCSVISNTRRRQGMVPVVAVALCIVTSATLHPQSTPLSYPDNSLFESLFLFPSYVIPSSLPPSSSPPPPSPFEYGDCWRKSKGGRHNSVASPPAIAEEGRQRGLSSHCFTQLQRSNCNWEQLERNSFGTADKY